MVSLKKILLENRGESAEFGCLMAMFPEYISEKLVSFGKKIIPEQSLYLEGDEFGRETEGHVTIRYGFTKDLNELQVRQLLKGQKPFVVELYGLDKFGGQPNDVTADAKPYDVIYLKARSGDLNRLNEESKKFPHVDTYREYHPHATLAYVKPGSFSHVKEGMNLRMVIDTICYSPISGGKSYFDLKEEG